MVNPTTKQIIGSTKLVVLGVMESVMAFGYLCSKHTCQAKQYIIHVVYNSKLLHSSRTKRLLSWKKKKRAGDGENHGDGGLWQRTILMGDKCQPLDFDGVIYYDSNGKRVPELPVKSANGVGHVVPCEMCGGHRKVS